MKVLHILNHFLPAHLAGTEVYAYNLGKELSKNGVEVVYLIPNYGAPINDEYVFDGLRVVKYAEPSIVDRALQMGQRKPDGLKNFLEILKVEQPNMVHFHEIAGSNGITFSHVAAAKKLGLKVVMTFHLGNYTAISEDRNSPTDIFDKKIGSFNFYQKKGFSTGFTKLIFPIARIVEYLKVDVSAFGKIGTALSVPQIVSEKKKNFLKLISNCDAVVTIANWYYKALLENGVNAEKLFFIEQGIRFAGELPTTEVAVNEKIKLIFVGRISHFKGIKSLIEAMNGMDTKKIYLDIYGDSGEDRQYIMECKKMAEGKSNIRFLGRLTPEEVIATMMKYDVLVLPSEFSEMSPLVIREAFAAGIPVLASNAFGNAEQIKDGENGWLFQFKSSRDLQKKIQMLVNQPDLITKAKSNLPVVRTFKEVADEYLSLYQNILAKA